MSGTEKDGAEALWIEAQRNVIGAMVLDPACIPGVVMETEEADFSVGFYRECWVALRGMSAEGAAVDWVTLASRLSKGGRGYVAELEALVGAVVTSANVSEYVRILREQSRLLALRQVAAKLMYCSSLDDAKALTEQAEALTVDRRRVKARSWAQMVDRFMEGRKENQELPFLRWGIHALNDCLHVRTGEGCAGRYILLGGEPSAGKSALMFQLALDMSKEKRVCVFSFETDEDEMAERMVANISRVPLRGIVRNHLDGGDWQKLIAGFRATYKHTLDTVEATGLTAEDICSMSRAGRYDLIFVDYVQLVSPSNPRDVREQQVAKISRTLHDFAHQSAPGIPGCTVVALSQLSRPDTDRNGAAKEPGLHSFRESGQLEQDADVAMIIYKAFPKAEYGTKESKFRKLAIVKNKKDSLNRMNLVFDGNYQQFSYIRPDEFQKLAYGRTNLEEEAGQTALPI